MDIIAEIIREARRRNLSHRTTVTYLNCINRFLRLNKKGFKEMTKEDVKCFLDVLVDKNKASKTLNVYFSALKFLFNDVLGKKWSWKIKYSKNSKKLPIFLTKEEVRLLINSIENEKHKLAIELMYSAGLRVSELINLKVKDLQLDHNYGFVREGKGRKDRLFILSLKLKENLLKLAQDKDQEDYLFTTYKNVRYNPSTFRTIIKNAAKRSNLKKKVSCHTLRHSFATHLIENGYDVASVQSLLGHNSSQTTMIYIHMASPNLINVKSPYDTI